MSSTYLMYYLFRPKHEFLELMLKHPGWESFKEPKIWTMEETYGSLTDEDRQIKAHMTRMKLVFLVKLAREYLTDNSRYAPLGKKQIIHDLFGDPPRFNLENFERWWEIERFGGGSDFVLELKSAKSEDFGLIEKTGDPDIDNWLAYGVSALEKRESENKE